MKIKEVKEIDLYSTESAFTMFIFDREYSGQTYREHLNKFAKDEKYRKKVFEYLDKAFIAKAKIK